MITADSSNEPPQPSRLEKNRNTPLRYPVTKRRKRPRGHAPNTRRRVMSALGDVRLRPAARLADGWTDGGAGPSTS